MKIVRFHFCHVLPDSRGNMRRHFIIWVKFFFENIQKCGLSIINKKLNVRDKKIYPAESIPNIQTFLSFFLENNFLAAYRTKRNIGLLFILFSAWFNGFWSSGKPLASSGSFVHVQNNTSSNQRLIIHNNKSPQ
jgi:hypothetical protein